MCRSRDRERQGSQAQEMSATEILDIITRPETVAAIIAAAGAIMLMVVTWQPWGRY
jgi:hypothetical protein